MTIANLEYTHALCTACATLVETHSAGATICTSCKTEIESPSNSIAYRYAEATIYYGYQYRSLFERQKGDLNAPKYSLSFLGEAFTFIALAAVSGVVGNLTYDVVKAALVRIRDQAKEKSDRGADYKSLGELTDDDLDRIYEYSKSYAQAFEDLEKAIRDDLVEEMMADAMGDAVAHNPDLLKILVKKKSSTKEQKKVVKAITAAMKKQPYAQKPPASSFQGFWNKLKK